MATGDALLNVYGATGLARSGPRQPQHPRGLDRRRRAGEVAATFCRAGGGAKAALSGDGRLLVVAAGTGITELWEIPALPRSGGQRCPPTRGVGPVASLDGDAAIGIAFGPQVYTLDPDELVAIARERATRSLTIEECEAYLPGPCTPAHGGTGAP